MNGKSLIAAKFRSLAKSFERFAEKGLTPTARGVDAAELRRYEDIQEEAGALIATAFRRGYLPELPGLAELVGNFDNPPPTTGICHIVPCASNLFIEFCGNNWITVTNTGHGCVVEPGAKTRGGVMPTIFPEVLPGVPVANLQAGYPEWQSTEEHHALICNWLAETVAAPADNVPEAADSAWRHTANDPRPDHFQYGPLPGTAAELNRWIGGGSDPNARQLHSKGRRGLLWIVKRDRYAYEVWFQNQGEIDAAKKQATRE